MSEPKGTTKMMNESPAFSKTLNDQTPKNSSTGNESKGWQVSLVIIGIIISFFALYSAKSVVYQLLFSFYAFFLLDPIIEWASRKKISRLISAPIAILVLTTLLFFTLRGLYGKTYAIAQDLPQYSEKIKKSVESLITQTNLIKRGTNSIIPSTTAQAEVQKVEVVERFDSGLGKFVVHGASSIAESVAIGLLMPILVLFLLIEKPFLSLAVKNIVPSGFDYEEAVFELSTMLRSFFLGNILVGFGTAIGFYFLFIFIGLENPIFLSLVAAFLNLAPMIGAVLGAILPMFQAFLQFDSYTPMLVIFGASVFLHFLIANFVIPKIIGSRINVNTTAATIGFIFWGWIFGAVGLLLAVPLTASIRIFFSARESTKPWARLIAEPGLAE